MPPDFFGTHTRGLDYGDVECWMRPAARQESKMARQSKREVTKTPLWSVNKVVNVASSMVTMPPIRSGPCSGMRGASARCS